MLAITTGIVTAYLTDYALTGNGGWRWMFGLGVVPAIGLTFGMWFLPDSPRWLISKSKIEDCTPLGVGSGIYAGSNA
jgi:MFS family permease